MVPLELTDEEYNSLLTALQSYRQGMLDKGMVCYLPKQYDNVVTIINKLQFNERSR